ncbi:MAG: phosphate signaling complex protein PhoU [Lachnospiraceae bacterium]|nr:phosphate signaling complex protein PhoU [Lachnospiraceae bacterium]
MRNKFDEQLRQLSEELMIMADMIEGAIQKAVKAFLNQDAEAARVIMNGDALVDQEQKKIENICFQLLIQQQPVARDLRMITAAMKMVTDMERIGDQAADISELTVMMAGAPYRVDIDNLKRMAAETMTMLISAIEAFVEKDMDKARRVINHDDVVDDLFVAVKTELIEVMKNYPADEEQAADLLMVNKYLERVGDHAVNIAEWVIFSLNDTPTEQPS